MKEDLEKLYSIKIISIIKNSSKTYKIKTEKEEYLLKCHEDNSLENVFVRLSILHLDYFLIPLKSIQLKYIETIEHQFFSLTPYIEDEEILAKDLRLSFYIRGIATLHSSSTYPLKVGDGFFDESIQYLDKKINEVKDDLQSRIERVEREAYHSPSDWFFLMNYQHYFLALKESDRYLSLLEEEWKKSQSLHISLTYQNFSYDHILVKNEKIISLDKMALAPSIYDLVDLFDKTYFEKINVSYLIKNYLAIHPLEDYEKYWVLSFLFIPKIKREKDDVKDIEALVLSLNYITIIEEIATNFLSVTAEK